jgi:fumarate reductase flavoprotein subunit
MQWMRKAISISAITLAVAMTAPAFAADYTADVVVIGAGASGSAAALASQQSGAKTILLEKTPFQMGAGSFAGGMFAADSSQQKAAGKTVDKKWLFNQYLSLSGGFQNSLLVRRIIDESGKTVDWLNANGCRITLVDAGTGGAYAHIGMPATLHGYQDGGAKALVALKDSFLKAGGQALFSTRATELIKDAKGNVTGVRIIGKDGKPGKVTAKAVVIASGGFGGNKDMLERYIGVPYTMGEVTQNTGDGIQMAWKAGAGKRGENVAQYFWETFSQEEMGKITKQVGDDWFALTDFTRYPNLRVNTNGRRFSNETDATLYSVHGAEIAMQPHQTEFVIVDSGMLDKVKAKGFAAIEEQYANWKGDKRQYFQEFNEPNDTDELSKAENTPKDVAAFLDKLVGNTATVYKANSIPELARAIGVDEKNFAASVEQYNKAYHDGKDPLFFADGKRLIPVEKGPFYAVRFTSRLLGTLGGIRVDDRLRAVTSDATPINGLWAVGADAGGMYGKAYVDFEGGTLGFAYTSGRLAGEDAAHYAKTH